MFLKVFFSNSISDCILLFLNIAAPFCVIIELELRLPSFTKFLILLYVEPVIGIKLILLALKLSIATIVCAGIVSIRPFGVVWEITVVPSNQKKQF